MKTSENYASGAGLPPMPEPEQEEAPGERRVVLTPASAIAVRPVHWLWDGRIPLGALSLIGGREGIGKSTVAFQLAADLTRGKLDGRFKGQPRDVIVCATEDSWEHTIVPRLMAAGADLNRVHRAEVTIAKDISAQLILPRDLDQLGRTIDDVSAALVLLDPLMSRLDSRLDTHKDGEVRRALEPLVRIAGKHDVAVIGLIHVNKTTGSADALTRLMGSRAFAAVARAVLFVMTDPEDEGTRLLGQAKNNLGRTDLPTLTLRIDQVHVTDTEEGPVFTARMRWVGETTRTITDALDDADGFGDRTAVGEAREWLISWLVDQGGTDEHQSISKAGRAAGHSIDALKRARKRAGITSKAEGFPRRTWWSLPGTQPEPDRSECNSLGRAPTALTTPTAPTESECSQRSECIGGTLL